MNKQVSITALRQVMRFYHVLTYARIAKLTVCSSRTAWDSVNASGFRGTKPLAMRTPSEIGNAFCWAQAIINTGKYMSYEESRIVFRPCLPTTIY